MVITIPITPKAQARDRIGIRGGKAISYKSKQQRLAENILLTCLMDAKPSVPLSGAISLSIAAYVPIPQSKPRKWRESALQGEIRPTIRPDVDNYAKQVCDVMTGIYFQDDRQIVDLTVSKYYSDTPQWVIVLEEIK